MLEVQRVSVTTQWINSGRRAGCDVETKPGAFGEIKTE